MLRGIIFAIVGLMLLVGLPILAGIYRYRMYSVCPNKKILEKLHKTINKYIKSNSPMGEGGGIGIPT
jgi:hypothetical protein